jgi:CheY-like chemotaxis protein
MTRAFRILVVDDDEDNACSLGELFELFDVHLAAFGGLRAPGALLGGGQG